MVACCAKLQVEGLLDYWILLAAVACESEAEAVLYRDSFI